MSDITEHRLRLIREQSIEERLADCRAKLLDAQITLAALCSFGIIVCLLNIR